MAKMTSDKPALHTLTTCLGLFYWTFSNVRGIQDCTYTTSGADYIGNKSTTISGRTCQRWDSQYPHKHTRNDPSNMVLARQNEANYCRNPDSSSGTGPWCYTTDSRVRWESCGIPHCPDCMEEGAASYTGKQSVTKSGLTCQQWISQSPHKHNMNDPNKYPYAVYNMENFCRNPTQEDLGPWCFTTDPQVRKESCGISACRECRMSSFGMDYRGHQSVTKSGRTCQHWDAQTPHEHNFNDVSRYPLAAHNEENFCRNPSVDSEGPWCYTTDPNVRWETCNIPYCPVQTPQRIQTESNTRDVENATPKDAGGKNGPTPYKAMLIGVAVGGSVVIVILLAFVVSCLMRNRKAKRLQAVEGRLRLSGEAVWSRTPCAVSGYTPRPLPHRPNSCKQKGQTPAGGKDTKLDPQTQNEEYESPADCSAQGGSGDQRFYEPLFE